MNINDYVIVSDFDGTITTCDSNNLLFDDFGTSENKIIEEQVRSGELCDREAYIKHYDAKPLTYEQYNEFLDEHIKIDRTFAAFYSKVNSKGLSFYIVSGGFRHAISRVLRQFNIPKINIFSNDVIMEKHLKPLFAQSGSVCTEDIGPCGNCKKTCIETIRELTNKKILFIGDGSTDRCAVRVSDYIFAKGSLAKYCDTMGIDYHSFNDFADISNIIFNQQMRLDCFA